jgi:hypothetical protein
MTTIQIESNIPPPLSNPYKSLHELLQHMKIGDSVLVPRKTAESIRVAGIRQGARVVTRKQKCGRYRVWRVENLQAN